ncbi:transposase [Aliidiomarina halalkaliphila]|uniref:Transposase n=1 Tax=Aliidiomarina halalkaliphila TaxID=2593535 RepID=A0A552X590_9GAMM|nr:transposase [Aliidiomarina halalkaliphila]TRW50168.1 transposase [Aliidiomarina halalkaliphila]
MSTKRRYCVVGTPHHVYQRGVDRKEIFFSKDLRRTYLRLMEKYAKEACVQVHAYVLMGNHVHILLTAMKENGISMFMQNLNSVFVSKVNKVAGREGVLFSTRFKSIPVETMDYLLQLYRYIELNPVRANLTQHPGRYIWSSYHANALGYANSLITPHPDYLMLGDTVEKRLANYRKLVHSPMANELIEQIRWRTRLGYPIGSEKFLELLEEITGLPSNPRRRRSHCSA